MQADSRDTPRRPDVRNQSLAWAATVAGLTLMVVACAGDTGSPSKPPSKQVTVQMTDFHLALPQETFTPGTYTFVAVNAGQTGHALAIDGPGVVDQHTQGILQPGQSASLMVTLHPGSYDVYCPVDGHRGEGMETRIIVPGPAPGGTRESGS
ncbi:MAG TPA: sulfocyanin-like copper-binding protein [Pseudonocardiaceae bacterium]|jgi:uncharacterized cupredoxin-like copper-binding protein